MQPTCLNNLIGVKCLTSGTPTSGLYINDLEGLNLKYAANIADSDFISGLQFLNEKITFATKLVISDLTRYALPYFRINSIVDELSVGDWTNTSLGVQNADRGVHLQVKRSRMLRINVTNIKIKIGNANTTHDVWVDDGNVQTQYSFTTNAQGEAEINLNFTSTTPDVYIYMDNSTINVNNSSIKTGCGCSSKSGQYLSAYGWNGSGNSNSTYGIKVQANAICDNDEFACVLGAKLGLPILYRSGIEILHEAVATDRLNSLTLLDTDKINFLLENWTAEYDKQMKMLIESLPQLLRRIDECCIVCNQNRYIQGLP